jgi:hypothetical protein
MNSPAVTPVVSSHAQQGSGMSEGTIKNRFFKDRYAASIGVR